MNSTFQLKILLLIWQVSVERGYIRGAAILNYCPVIYGNLGVRSNESQSLLFKYDMSIVDQNELC